MKRLIPFLLLVVAAAIAVFSGMGGDSDNERAAFDPRQLALFEQRFAAGDPGGAREALERDTSIGDAERLYGLAALAMTERRLDDALRDARAARVLAPRAWRPLSLEFTALSGLGRSADAAVLVTDAVDRAPDDERVLALAAHHWASTPDDPDPHLALELLDRIAALPTRKAGEGDPTAVRPHQLLLVRYMASMAIGAYEEALAVAREFAALEPGDPSLDVLVGEAARGGERLADAIAAYSRAVKGQPGRRDWRMNLIQLLLENPSTLQEALHQTQALLEQGVDRDSLILRARVLARAEKIIPNAPDEAVGIYRALLARNADDLPVLRNLALLLYDWKQGGQDGTYLDESYALLRRYVFRGGVIDDKLDDTWEKLQARAEESLSPEVVSAVGLAFDADPGDPGVAEAYRAALVAQGNLREAGNVVRRALAAAPDNAAVRILAARHFLADGPDQQAETALVQLDEVTRLMGGDESLPESVVWLRALAYIWADRNEEAYVDAERLLALRPREPAYLEAVGRAALGCGRYSEAEAKFREAMSLAPRPELQTLIDQAVRRGAE